MNNFKRGKIPPYYLFFLLYISRVVVSLTYIQSISVGIMSGDLLISILLSFIETIILSIPAYICVTKNINPIFIKVLQGFYCAFFIYKAAISIARFTGFSTSRLNPDANSIVFAFMISVCVMYCTYLGLEGISRFSIYAGISIILAMLFIIALNIENFKIINLYPLVKNDNNTIFYNSLIMTSNSIEPAILLCLSKHINGDVKKTYFISIFAEYLTIFVLILVTLGVLGANATIQPYPIFTLFQMATGKTLSRLDIIHTAFWILAIFIKCCVLIYSATICVNKYKHSMKCVVFTGVSLVASLLITEVFVRQVISISKPIAIVSYFTFCVVIPFICLIFDKKNRRGKLEKID